MRLIGDIYLEELVVHILDPVRGEGGANLGFVPSLHPLLLDQNPAVRAYFSRHIIKSLQTPTAKAAVFKHISKDEVSGICAGLLDGSVSLVEGSVEIGQALFAILEQDHRTRPGDLAMGFYHAVNDPTERFLALLKIDPSQVFRHLVEEQAEGNVVSFQEVPAAFTDKELQKCAFIRSLEPRHELYDMILLDRLVEVSHYFKEDLLDAEERYDSRERTRKLYQAITAAHNELRPSLSDQQNARLDAQKHGLVTSRSTNLDIWLDQLELPSNAKAQIDQQIRSRLPDRAFTLDVEFGTQLVSRRYFEAGYGLKVQFEALHYEDVVESEEPIMNDAGEEVGRRILLRAERWREIAK